MYKHPHIDVTASSRNRSRFVVLEFHFLTPPIMKTIRTDKQHQVVNHVPTLRSGVTRVMIVEDSAFCRLFIGMTVSNIQYLELASSVSSGDQMKKTLVTDSNIQVILMDMSLGEETGITLTEYIKINYPNIHVIAFTSCENPDSIMNMVLAGASGHVLKDVTHYELEIAINSVLNGKQYFSLPMAFRIVDQVVERI